MALPPYRLTYSATCGVTCIRRTAATQARVSYSFVGTDRDPPRRQRQLAEHHDCGVTFGRPAGRRDRRIDNQSVPILGQQMRRDRPAWLHARRLSYRAGHRDPSSTDACRSAGVSPWKFTVGFFGLSGGPSVRAFGLKLL